MKVYLDYAATTPVKKEVLSVMLSYLKDKFGNPSSIHSWGREAREGIDEAREKAAKFLGAEPSEIVFTSGATESVNLAILGLLLNFQKEKPHVISTMIEHHDVLNTLEYLAKKDLAEVTFLKPSKEGLISVDQVKGAIKTNTRLVTIMYVNNEIGTIEPIREIGKLVEKENEKREKRIYYHTDAVQGIGYLNSDVKFLHVDLLSLSAHKIYGPKGTGLLFVKKDTPVAARLHGGAQEFSLRPGTENVAGIVGLGKAMEIVAQEKSEGSEKIKKLRDYFIENILKEIPDVELNGSKIQGAPHIANLYFKFIEGESIVLALDLEGVACSTGSACTSQSLEPSHVLINCHNDHFRAAGSVRFSFGDGLTKKELDFAIAKIKSVVTRLRSISPYGKEQNGH